MNRCPKPRVSTSSHLQIPKRVPFCQHRRPRRNPAIQPERPDKTRTKKSLKPEHPASWSVGSTAPPVRVPPFSALGHGVSYFRPPHTHREPIGVVDLEIRRADLRDGSPGSCTRRESGKESPWVRAPVAFTMFPSGGAAEDGTAGNRMEIGGFVSPIVGLIFDTC